MKLFEKKYHFDKHDYHVFAKMLKKYDILGYGLTIVYSIGLLVMAVLSFLYIDINEMHFKALIIMQGFFGLYLLYSWTSGYKTTARAILNLFLHGYKDVNVDFYEDHLDIVYEDGSLRNLPYKNIQNIRRSNSFF
nr:hypothetical protein [Lachnospiraceae bacterium]